MSNTLELDTLYKISPIEKIAPQGGIEIVSASSDVTIRATTDSHFTGDYNELPEIINNGAAGDFYKSDVLSIIKYISVSCSDLTAKVVLSGCHVRKAVKSELEFFPHQISCSMENFVETLRELFPNVETKNVTKGNMVYDESSDMWLMTIKNSSDETLGTYQQYAEDWENAGFTFIGTFQDGATITFTCTIK
ncbi:MAG: hypothetical protein MJ197_07725 [Bacteroidales bacterium]|nr:hypothetical protein [Bacteroidales bacterium]